VARSPSSSAPPPPPPPTEAEPPPKTKDHDTLVLALAQLGYRKSEIDQALAGLAARGLDGADVPTRLSHSLKILSGG
jgi:Holliday junction resolvasome RuvABC DNA-binding subunit